jgi:phosphatidylglycerol lysyltransferase
MLVAGVLYVLLPSHQGLTLPAFFSIYLLALVAGLISHVPGGLGVFEIVFLALLPKEMLGANGLGEAVVGALVVYRAIYYLLPLVVGSIMLGAYELHQRREDVRLAARVAGRWVSLLVPNVFAFTTLLGGAILLFSAARPVDFERAAWLAQWVPQWVMELSHLFSALAGLGLLLMAYNLQRRLDAAYLWTVVLLPLGALFSVLKGFDYEESIVLGFIFLALLPCRRDFYRQAPILTGRLSPAWVAITTAFLFCTVWLAVFSHKHVQYANSLWWNFDLLDHQGDTARHFRALGDAARALRAGLGVSLVMAWYIFGKLSRPPLPEPTLPTSAELDLARSVVVASPAAYANLALAGDKSLLFNDRKNAFIMYAVEERSWVALGDPVGPPAEAAELAWTFRELVEAKGGSPVFYEAGTDDLVLYSELGLQPLVIGEEARVPLETVPEATLPVAAAPAELWRALDEFQKQGGTFEIVQPPSVEPLLGQLQAVADGWAARSQVGQKRFSSGSLDPDYLRQCAVAVLRSGGRMVAFATLALAADREELAVNLVRYLPEAPPEALDHLLASLVLWGREQGYRWLNLGLTPVENAAADHALAPLWAHLGVLFFRHGEHFRDFQSLRQYKAKFEPIWQPKYLLCPAGWALPHILVNVAALIAPPHEPPAK